MMSAQKTRQPNCSFECTKRYFPENFSCDFLVLVFVFGGLMPIKDWRLWEIY